MSAAMTAPASLEKIQSALNFVCPDDRETWVRVGMAIKSETAEEGEWLWHDWSKGASSYHEADAKAVWRSIKAGGKIGIGTLFHLAKENGWSWTRPERRLSAADIDAMREASRLKAEAAAAEKAADQAKAAELAAAIWNGAEPATAHPYLIRKRVSAHGLRVGVWDVVNQETGEVRRVSSNALLVPIKDRTGRIHSLQAILPNRPANGTDKLYLAGGAKAGNFYAIGKPKELNGRKVWLLAEGYATGASLHEITGHAVLVCFDASNLLPVAAAIRERQPDAIILLAADDDRFTVRKDGSKYNPGVDAATKAAQEVGGYLAVPQFASLDGEPSDWNDLASREGAGVVAEQIAAVLAGAPVQAEAEPADEHVTVVDVPGAGVGAQMQADRGHRKAAPKQENSAEFGEPIDLFGVSMPPQVPLSALPASIAAYAKDQSALLGSDHSIVAMTALVAAAACITDGIKLQPKRMDPTWTESARLWVGVVGDPSTKKSPSISKAVRHVKRLEARLAEKNAAAYGDWKVRHEEWKLEKKESKGRNAAQEPAAPPMKRLIVEDTTVEALGEVLKDNDRGVLCLQDELTGWFAGMDAYKSGGGKGANKDRAHWLEAYNGGPRSIDRISRQSITIPNWSVCMIGGIQPDMMRRIANGMGNDGLLQRFMILVARPSQKGEDRYPDRTAMDQFAALFDHLEALEPADESVTMSEAAHQARERIEVFTDKMIRAFDHPHMQAWLGKWEGLFARLVLLYHVIECAEESIYPTTKKVTGETAEKVERLMCGTLLHHAIHFYQEVVDAHDRQSNMRQLARLILARGMSVVTKRDIHLYWRASRKLQQWEVKAVIDGLCNLDWLTPDETSLDVVDGKPKTWFVNPAVHTAFADHAERERTRREEAVEALRELKRAYAEA